MSIKLGDYLAKLPEKERQAVEVRTQELIMEERTLRELRIALSHSQEQIAHQLQTNQAAVSKLERRADMYISSLRRLIRAMGGELEVVARFPGRPPVLINQFKTLTGGPTS